MLRGRVTPKEQQAKADRALARLGFTDEQISAAILQAVSPNTAEAKFMQDKYDEMSKLWDAALEKAVEKTRQEEKKIQARQEAQLSTREQYSIREGMTDEERYEELKDKRLKPATVRADRLANLDSLREDEKKNIRKIANALGITGIDLKNSHIEFPFRFSGNNASISEHHQLNDYGGTRDDFLKALSCLDELVENAELIEVHSDYKIGSKLENKDLKRTHVLLSISRREFHCACRDTSSGVSCESRKCLSCCISN